MMKHNAKMSCRRARNQVVSVKLTGLFTLSRRSRGIIAANTTPCAGKITFSVALNDGFFAILKFIFPSFALFLRPPDENPIKIQIKNTFIATPNTVFSCDFHTQPYR